MIKEITVIETSPCMADSTKLKGITQADCDLTELLPYVNSEVERADYKPGSITFKKGVVGFTIMNKSINITKFDNTTHLYELLDWVMEFLNDIEARKDKIIPSNKTMKYPAPTEIYKLLPKTNCGQCGELSCMAFAAKLSRMNAELTRCIPLYSEEYSEKLKKLSELLP